jgi:hypothetical protein
MPMRNCSKFTVELLRSTFRKLEGFGEAFDIKAHHDVYKDPSVKGLAFRIHRLAEKFKNLPVVKQAAHHTSSSMTAAPTAMTAATTTTAATTVTTAATAATTATTAGLRLIDRLPYQLVTIICVCFCVVCSS